MKQPYRGDPNDGIGKEVVPEGGRILDDAASALKRVCRITRAGRG